MTCGGAREARRGGAARQPPPDSVGGSWRCELTVRVTDRPAARRPRRRQTAGAATPGPRRGGAGTCRPETCNGAGFCCYPVPLGVEWFSHFSELRGVDPGGFGDLRELLG